MNINLKKQKGFTLVELLMVIAIIGILASVIFAGLSNARDKSHDAVIQSQLSSMRSQAELYFITTGSNSYGSNSSTCSGAGSLFVGVNSLQALLTALPLKDCGNTNTQWSVAAVDLSSNIFYCVDATGIIRTKTVGGTSYTALHSSSTAAHAGTGSVSCQ